MRRVEERQQWEHTDEEEALYGLSETGAFDMPPSMRKREDEAFQRETKLRAERDEARSLLSRAREALEEVVAMEHKSNATEATRLACGDPCPCVNQAVAPARAALEAISRLASPPPGRVTGKGETR